MKDVTALGLALLSCEFGGPALSGVLGMKATSGFDAADMVCFAVGFAVFFLIRYIASFV